MADAPKADLPKRLFDGWVKTFANGNMLETYGCPGAWWAILHRQGWRMDRGPYPIEAMAKLAFPVQRFTWKGGN
jgi:hypothetical protein